MTTAERYVAYAAAALSKLVPNVQAEGVSQDAVVRVAHEIAKKMLEHEPDWVNEIHTG